MRGWGILAAIVLLLAGGVSWLATSHDATSVAAAGAPAVTSILLPAETAALPDTPSGTLVSEKCTACHSVGMITQQPRMDSAKWTATVTKMREAYHAPIAPGEDAALAAALVALQQGSAT